MRDRYPMLQNQDADGIMPDGVLVPGAWRGVGVMREMQAVQQGPRANRKGKQQRIYLKQYFNSLAGSVPWQDHAIEL